MRELAVFDPFADFTHLRRQIDRMVEGASAAPTQEGRIWRPAVDLFEDQDALVLKLDVPEVDRSKLDIQLSGEELVVRGERRWEKPESSTCVHSERPFGQFQRVFRLGVPIEPDGVTATFRDGALTIRLPKKAELRPRKIDVAVDG